MGVSINSKPRRSGSAGISTSAEVTCIRVRSALARARNRATSATGTSTGRAAAWLRTSARARVPYRTVLTTDVIGSADGGRQASPSSAFISVVLPRLNWPITAS